MSVDTPSAPRSPEPRNPRRGLRLRRFRRSESGVVAIEFAAVSIPFFALLFAILETSLVFFAGQILDNATADAARQIRTGQAQQAGWSQGQFRSALCDGLIGIFDCQSRLYLDVKTITSFSDADLDNPINEDGELETGGFGYTPGGKSEIVVVRAFYRWPVVLDLFGMSMSNVADGDRLLSSVVAFRNEPFPW